MFRRSSVKNKYKFCKIHRKHLSARLYFQLSCRDSACKFIKKEMFSCESWKILKFFFLPKSLQITSGRLPLCFASFSETLVEKALIMILQHFRNRSCKFSLYIVWLSQLLSACYLKMPKFHSLELLEKDLSPQ